jgi:acyl-CoA thioesterase-1
MPDGLEALIYFVGSGLAFFVGVGMVVLGVSISPFTQRRLIGPARNLVVLLGGLFVAISAVPLNWWLYTALATLTSAWLAVEWFATGRRVVAARIAVAMIWVAALAIEMPYHFTPTLPALGKPKLFLIGDSVSAGMSEHEQGRWPSLFVNDHDLEVVDLSKMGATVGTARKQADAIGNAPGLVLLEIGGNDTLGSTTPDQFEERLEILLEAVCRDDRTIVMLELPLPPFANRFGQIQRQLARKHHVFLIPRRVLTGVLTTPGATVDGIHLSPAGHRLMADTMWRVLQPAYE